MDNLTHTLVGVLVGEATAHTVEHRSGLDPSRRRNLLVTMLAVGSNAPDFDLLISGGKLDYLLHHRGHTHTFVAALLTALLIYLFCELWIRLRKLRATAADRRCLALAAPLGPVLHIFMDMTNNYGVHPWWPFDNRWLYGDAVFIIEPLFWIAAAPLAFTLRTRLARACIVGVLAIGVGLVFLTGMVPLAHAIAFTALAAVVLFLARRASPRGRLALGVGMWLAVTCALMSGSRAVERRIDALAAEAFTEAVLLDRVITPMPVNPFCWEFIFVQQERDELALRRGMIALAPNWIAAGRCPGRSLDVPTTATLARVERPNDATIQWHGEARSSIADLQALWRSDCRVEAFMRYARAPYLQRTERGWVIGDLRYDREPELGFAELDLEAPAQCSSWTAPWTPPRASLAPMS